MASAGSAQELFHGRYLLIRNEPFPTEKDVKLLLFHTYFKRQFLHFENKKLNKNIVSLTDGARVIHFSSSHAAKFSPMYWDSDVKRWVQLNPSITELERNEKGPNQNPPVVVIPFKVVRDLERSNLRPPSSLHSQKVEIALDYPSEIDSVKLTVPIHRSSS